MYRDIQHDYEHNFLDMMAEPVPLDTLLAARDHMLHEILQGLDENKRRFLLSLIAGMPAWSLRGIAHLKYLPGVRWRLYKLTRLKKPNTKKFAVQANLLAARLAGAASCR